MKSGEARERHDGVEEVLLVEPEVEEFSHHEDIMRSGMS
jgi:hypothetical protein